jgi:division protein CdvB (Snf7/Vps24/ESCRT-III family)
MPNVDESVRNLYNQVRSVYRSLEQERADLFYRVQNEKKRLVNLESRLNEVSTELDHIQETLKQMERGEWNDDIRD